MNNDDLSNIARSHDASFARYTDACDAAEAAANLMREGVKDGRYSEPTAAAIVSALSRFESDPEFFLIRVPNALSAPPEVLATDYGKHGMDGQHLPRTAGFDFANAVARRNSSRTDIRDNWEKMSEAERMTRTRP